MADSPQGRRLVADLALLLVCLVWGSTFVVVKDAVSRIPALTFLCLRFLLATGVLALVFCRPLGAHWRRLARPGLVTGLCLGFAYLAQTVGLQYTQASRAGFITGLSVVIVPVLSPRLLGERPPRRALVGVALALAGLALLSFAPATPPTVGASPADAATLLGDALVLACAVGFAVHITLLGKYSAREVRSAGEAGVLATLQVGVAGLGYTLATLVELVRRGPSGVLPGLEAPVVGAVVLTAVLATAGAFLVQTAAQRHTTPTHTALIFASEPVFAALFGWMLLGERLGGWALAGCGLILAGMVAAELPAGRETAP
ncbi:MAG: DMT family transporter [Firmicutes bacterium]|nr:DMT family transporter [Bacillota bacterium]